MRAWAKANEDTLVKYLQAYIEGVRWSLDPPNRRGDRLADRPAEARRRRRERGLCGATDPAEGFAKDGALDLEGFRNVLKLRATHLGTWGGTPPAPEKYSISAITRRRCGLAADLVRKPLHILDRVEDMLFRIMR
jgi:ABC-type nitrate/sulfonate/bicarbonate transport system substrate-binding protein